MQLRGRGVMKQIDFLADGTKVWAAPGAGVPAVSDIRSLYTEKQFGKLYGSSAYFQSVIEKSAGAMSQPTSIYRIISREHTPFYFSKASVGGGGGRFDLPSTGTTGTCYFAESVYGAITEVYGQMLLVDVQAILVRRVCKVRNFATIDELLNIRDSDVASRLNLKSTFLSTMDRAATQEFAARVNTIGFKGIIYSLKTHVGRLGYAIFGVAGCAQPEDSGLGSWSVEVNDVGDDNSFWQWIADEQVSKDPESVLIMPNQLPLKSISP
jgi:hypothetical protein